jgi:hypothetical protein
MSEMPDARTCANLCTVINDGTGVNRITLSHAFRPGSMRF